MVFIPFKPVECQEALGMESGAISDSQISASSEFNADHAATQGRLHFQARLNPGKTGSWSAHTKDANQWLQVDLNSKDTKVTRVATQGRNDYEINGGQWVTKYKLQYSDDGVNFQYYKEPGQTTDQVN